MIEKEEGIEEESIKPVELFSDGGFSLKKPFD
jgi:hypothetical protein